MRINLEAHFKNAYVSGTLGSNTTVGVPRLSQLQLKDPLSTVLGICMEVSSLSGGHASVGNVGREASLLRAPGTIDLPRCAPPAGAPAHRKLCLNTSCRLSHTAGRGATFAREQQ
eukprot:COSAG02_NODE_1534_length_12054_cov_22.784442_1_plen_114_part_10